MIIRAQHTGGLGERPYIGSHKGWLVCMDVSSSVKKEAHRTRPDWLHNRKNVPWRRRHTDTSPSSRSVPHAMRRAHPIFEGPPVGASWSVPGAPEVVPCRPCVDRFG